MPSISWVVPSGSCQVYQLSSLLISITVARFMHPSTASPFHLSRLSCHKQVKPLNGLLLGHMALHEVLPQRCVSTPGEQPRLHSKEHLQPASFYLLKVIHRAGQGMMVG